MRLKQLQALKQQGKRFATITAYDATFAQVVAKSGIEVLLVGDSLGNVIQGKSSTVPVTMEQMCYHLSCVSEGLKSAESSPLVMADMPYMSYSDSESAIKNAAALMQSGAQMVKLEGGRWLENTVSLMTERGLCVCAHLGLTPQSVDALGGYSVQGREQSAAEQLVADAIAHENAGAGIILLECIPSELGQKVTEAVSVPVIGIGAGPFTDSQVLVLYDMLGLNLGKTPRFVKNYMENQEKGILGALETYHDEVLTGYYPAPEHCYD